MRVLDLFAGCGGFSLGFQNAGFDILAAFDHWGDSCRVYEANFRHPIFQVDLSDAGNLHILKRYKPDVIIGGPPCQDFSSAGKRQENSGRANLTLSFAHIIQELQPDWFVMENVERIKNSQFLERIIRIFKENDYGVSHEVLNACYCGVPQVRKRFILVGHKYSEDRFLNDILLKNQSPQPMSIYDYLGDKLNFKYYYRHPRSYARRGIFSIYEPSPTIRGVNRPIPKNYQKHEGDLCSPERVRSLTTLERSYIQTFPENFQWPGTKTSLEQMIGNAVPVKLAEYIGGCIIEYIKDREERSPAHQQLELFRV